MNKENLMKYIQKNSSFHRFANLSGHSTEQLQAIKERMDSQKRNGEVVTGIQQNSLHSLSSKK
jgi:hypothetical protein